MKRERTIKKWVKQTIMGKKKRNFIYKSLQIYHSISKTRLYLALLNMENLTQKPISVAHRHSIYCSE